MTDKKPSAGAVGDPTPGAIIAAKAIIGGIAQSLGNPNFKPTTDLHWVFAQEIERWTRCGELRAALERYGRHRASCGALQTSINMEFGKCVCGFDAARRLLDETKEEA